MQEHAGASGIFTYRPTLATKPNSSAKHQLGEDVGLVLCLLMAFTSLVFGGGRGDLGTSQNFENQALSGREESSSLLGKAGLGILKSPLCSWFSPQLLEKWILSEKEWEREKAVNLYLHLMKIYVQSVGVCVSPGDPPRLPPHPAQPAPLTPTGKCQSLS